MFLKRLKYYLDPRTLFGPSASNTNLRVMHGINRISILMFIGALSVLVWRTCGKG